MTMASPTMASPTMAAMKFALAALLACFPLVHSLPMQISINQRATECLYEKLEEGETATMSVFILAGAELKATSTLEGPVAPPDVDSGIALQDAAERYRRGERFGNRILEEEMVDFEHLQSDLLEDIDEEEYEEEQPKPNEDANARRERIVRNRQRAREKREKEERMRAEVQKKVRSVGEPKETTIKAKSAGWYRACLRANWYQIVAELELRKSSELGGMNQKTGHVYSYEDRDTAEQERLLEEATASQEEGMDDKDFDNTRNHLRKLRRLLSEIQTKQTQERHRLMVHKATNEHSHSRMVLSSLMETVLFMLVTGFQVYTIRKWFSGAPVLGR